MIPNHTRRALFVTVSLGWVLHSVSPAHGQVCDGGWRQVPLGPEAAQGTSIVFDAARGVTVMFGGRHEDIYLRPADYINKTWTWDGTAWTLRSESGPTPRWGSSMVYDSQRQVVVLYSGSGPDCPQPQNTCEDTWEWDGTSWTQRTSANGLFPPARASFGMSYDSVRGVTVLYGGYIPDDDGYNPQHVYLDDVWEWDGTNWIGRPAGPAPRAGQGMTFDTSRGVTVVAGGYDGNGVLTETWEYDGATWTLRSNSEPQVEQNGPWQTGSSYRLTFDSARGIVVGLRERPTGAGFHNTVEWDGSSWQYLDGEYLALNQLAYDEGRQVVVTAGGSAVSEWNGSTWTAVHHNPPLGLSEHAMYYDMDRRVTVLHGGYYGGSSDSKAVAWTWDTNDWQWTTPGPQAAEHALAYDISRRLAVLFGGVRADEGGEGPLGGTWLCDIVACSQAPILAPEPPWRRNAAMVYDSGRDRIVLFGGSDVEDDSSPFGDTWEWDGSRWTLQSTGGPTPRYGHAMAYDAARGVTVLFGGTGWTDYYGLQYFNDTWEWNGSQWLLRSVSGPLPRSEHAMVYDPIRGVVLLFGGAYGHPTCRYLSDTWEWKDGLWQLRTVQGPSARAFHAMTYDTDRNVVMLFGGNDLNPPPSNPELWEYAPGDCVPSDRPLAEYYPVCTGAPYATKNRYLSVVPPTVPNGATGIALRVTFGPMPGPSDCPTVPDFSAFNGVQMWVGPEVLRGGTVPTGVYELQSTPLFRDWTTVPGGVLQVSDCNIVPCATYTIESVSDVDYPAGPYSPPLVLATTATWGDIVDHGYGPGEGTRDVFDVLAMVDRFKSTADAPPKTWCDVYANRPSDGVNLNINALDITLVVDAIKGSGYPFTGPAAPGTCPGTP